LVKRSVSDPFRHVDPMTEADKIRGARKRLRKKYRGLFDEVSVILFAADPIGINFETNTDEYEPEVGTILPRLSSCSSASDVRKVVHEEFTRWFSPHDAGSETHYQKVAEDIWKAWQSTDSDETSG